jgi:hypothetical protein
MRDVQEAKKELVRGVVRGEEACEWRARWDTLDEYVEFGLGWKC